MAKLTYKQTAQFFAQLGALLKTNISLSRSLQLAGKIKHKNFEKYIQNLALKIDQGETLASTLILKPHYFDVWTVSLIAIAESSGILPFLCEKLAESAIKNQQQTKLYRQFSLDLIVTIWCILTVIAGIFNPKVTAIFSFEFWLRSFGIGLLLLIVGFWLRFNLNLTIQKVLNKIPVFAQVYQINSFLLFSKLYLPLSCGISLLTATELLNKHLNHYYLNPIFRKIIIQVKQGRNLTHIVKNDFPMTMISMLTVGEETGYLDESLIKIEDYYQQELIEKLQKIRISLNLIRTLAIGSLILAMGIKGIAVLMKGF